MIIPEITFTVNFDKKVKKSELVKISNSQNIYDVCKKVFNSDTFDWKEEMILFCLNSGHKVLGFYKLSSGGISETVFDSRVCFTIALTTPSTTAIILAHNHPSGNKQPSNEDIKLTKKVKDGGTILNIHLLDHIIVTDSDFYSFADEGIL